MNVRFLAPMLIALAAAGGCSKGVSLKTVAVSGKVTLNNQPLAGATVTFLPDVPVGSTALPAPSTGVTGADGSYKLSTMASGRQVVEGVPPGSFKVIIAKQQTSAPANPNPMAALEGLSDEERAKKVQSMSPDELAKMGGAPARAG